MYAGQRGYRSVGTAYCFYYQYTICFHNLQQFSRKMCRKSSMILINTLNMHSNE